MSKGCLAALLFVFLALVFLYQLAVPIFVIPINGQCYYNDIIPPNASINLSMDQWSTGGMWAGIIVFAVLFVSGRAKAESDWAMLSLCGLFLLYQIFDLIWNIIGVVIYQNFYKEVCREVEGYDFTMNLGINSGITVSCVILVLIVVFICMACRQRRGEAREPLVQQPQEAPQPQNKQQKKQERVKIEPEEERREEVVLTDAEYQRQQNVYARLF
jgi:hypothetical protein